jgi:hypothetical protein
MKSVCVCCGVTSCSPRKKKSARLPIAAAHRPSLPPAAAVVRRRRPAPPSLLGDQGARAQLLPSTINGGSIDPLSLSITHISKSSEKQQQQQQQQQQKGKEEGPLLLFLGRARATRPPIAPLPPTPPKAATMEDIPEGKHFSFPKSEEQTLEFWDRIDAFKEQLRRTEGKPEYVFYDGPPFATGLPHYGHILAGTLKVRGFGGGRERGRERIEGERAAIPPLARPPHPASPRTNERTNGKKKPTAQPPPPKKTPPPSLPIKKQDIVTRYASATGHYVSRRFGWDCHGLPVEYEIDKKLGVKSRDDVLAMGIAAYNEECRAIVMRYSSEWERTVRRLGRWIDFKNDYKTLDKTYMESVWWVFKQLHEKGLVYRGFKVMPFSTACATPLSNFEAGLNYKDVQDPAVTVAFPLVGDEQGASLVAWTTTPWTLPSNLALCVHPELEYVRARDPATGKVYVVAEARLCQLPGAAAAAEGKKEGGGGKGGKKGKAAAAATEGEGGGQAAGGNGSKAAAPAPAPAGFEILARFPGKDLDGLRYEPLFPYFSAHAQDAANHPRAFTVVTDGYVTSDSGTGVVHQAPAFGEDDYRVCLAHGVVAKGEGIPCPVDANGRFTGEVPEFAGK